MPNDPHADPLGPVTHGEGEMLTSTPDRYWRLFNDLGMPPPLSTTDPPAVLPEAFLTLVKQVQGMMEIMQTVVPLIPEIRRLTDASADPPHLRPSTGQDATGETRDRAIHHEGSPTRVSPAPSRAARRRPEPDTVSSDSADSFLKVQFSQVNRRLDEFRRELQRSRDESSEDTSGGSPFVQEIQEKPVPLNFRVPALETYDDGSDSAEHIAAFRTQMALYGTSDALMCRTFPTTFRGPARAWFSRLRQSSIASFDQFAKEFEQNFLTSARPRPSIAALLALSQHEEETLAQFVTRFAAEIRGYSDTHPSLIMQAFLTGLKPSRFFWSLIEKPPATVPEMLHRANQYVAGEALAAGRRPVAKKSRTEQPRAATSSIDLRPHRRPDHPEQRLPRPPPLPLNTPRTEIFLQIREKGLLRPPNPMRATYKNRSKYCRFHRDHGHDTEDCHDLQNQIEELIRRGYLGRYLKEPREATPRPRMPVERQVDVIIGGPAAGDSSSSARKSYARSSVEKRPRPELEPEISFGAEEGERSHHDNALVISVQIANARVKRVMVDTGSSADILYLDAFKRLGLPTEDLIPMSSALTGFTGDSISPLGTTTLPVSIGEEPRTKTIMTTFMVVNLPSAYNVILGRPTLNKLKAVVSTYHRAIKFPTSAGVGESRSDPGESRRCYLTAVSLPKRACPHIPDPREETPMSTHLEPPERLTEVPIKGDRPGQTVKIGTAQLEGNQLQLVEFLKANADVFAWSPKEMLGIDRTVAEHQFNINPEARPVKQRPRRFALDRQKAISEEVDRLTEAGFISEVKYP
ncbi:uncharacterized protein LOC103977328 [Musa acuminata AAA Group]|uniref:uncharacterized protein LOC103977328 n=2 Tax=Musa acuminata AAA Group TaxID=214697 RepID=UPI0031E0896E